MCVCMIHRHGGCQSSPASRSGGTREKGESNGNEVKLSITQVSLEEKARKRNKKQEKKEQRNKAANVTPGNDWEEMPDTIA